MTEAKALAIRGLLLSSQFLYFGFTATRLGVKLTGIC